MDKWGLRARLRYFFDTTMAAGTLALIGWLAAICLLVILIASAIIALGYVEPADSAPMGFIESVWASLMRAIDTGNLASDQGWGLRIVMLVVTLTGIFVVSALIGVLSTGLSGKLDQLRRGRSLVLETEHTIIFNWSEAIFDVIAQLVLANANRKRPRIVIMANRDKVEMETEITAKIGNRGNSKIICRSGDPTDLDDIAIVNAPTSRSIIILSPEGAGPDESVIKTILALVNAPNRSDAPYRIAAELRDTANAEVARVVGGREVQLILADDLIARIMVQSARQPRLSAIYTELLDFDKGEIYAVEQPQIEGKTFGDALLDYETCSLIGLCDANGEVRLNPPMETVIGPGAKAIIISEDDDRIETRPRPLGIAAADAALPPAPPNASRPERTLLLGWNRRAPMIARELSRYVGRGSLLTVGANTPGIAHDVASLELEGKNLTVELKPIDTGRRSDIDRLDPASYDHILVLGYSEQMAPQAADTRTLVTLLHLRTIREAAGQRMDIVSEIIDVRNLALIAVTRADDFVVSNKLVSQMLSQASENEFMEKIFRDLLDEEGSEIVLRPASAYVPLGVEHSFYDLVRAAAARGEVAIGHHIVDSSQGTSGLVINPTKSKTVAYAEGDRIIVLAQN
ncbi:MAG: hypothetical protein ABI744_07990 [Chloroflexota bacterium]